MTHRYLQHLRACRLFVMAAMVALATTLSFAPATADAAVTVPVNAKHFDGTFTITGFTTQTVNGVQLSPDEKTLYATNAGTIMAFDVKADGSLKNPRVFAMSGGDGLAIDNAGRLYSAVAAAVGIRVFSSKGELLGTIPAGVPPQSVGFAGRDKKTLFIVGRGAVYKTQMIAEGIRSRAK